MTEAVVAAAGCRISGGHPTARRARHCDRVLSDSVGCGVGAERHLGAPAVCSSEIDVLHANAMLRGGLEIGELRFDLRAPEDDPVDLLGSNSPSNQLRTTL